MNKLSVIIPVYNEEKTVADVVRKVEAVSLKEWMKEIIIVDDGSTDKTSRICKAFGKRCIYIQKKKNEGKGSAIVQGLRKATGDIILIQDADLEYSPSDYPTLLSPFSHPHVDVVYGSRFLGSHLSTMFVYELGNKFVTLMTNILFNTNITDMETGFKVFRKTVVSDMVIHAKRFDVEPELTAKILKRGYQIYEVPISYFGRKFEDGKKLTWRDGFIALWTLIKYRIID